MSETPAQIRLRSFATGLLEWRGALVEWPEGAAHGMAVLPDAVAEALGCAQTVALGGQGDFSGSAGPSGEPTLGTGLATDFLERAEPLLGEESRAAGVMLPEMYLKQGPMEEAVSKTFTWLNARGRVMAAKPVCVEYHTWHFLASFHSDDQWEDVISFSINAASGAEVALPDILADGHYEQVPSPILPENDGRTDDERRPTQQGGPEGTRGDTHTVAVALARAMALTRAKDFFIRLDARKERDRKRVSAYYQALLREAHGKKVKAVAASRENATDNDESSEENGDEESGAGPAGGVAKQENRERAVRLELQRKLLELDERYAIRAELAPVALLKTQVRVLAVECDIQRKQARRVHTVYWNPLLKALEPMACSRCGRAALAMAFTDADVAPLCSSCSHDPKG